MSNPNPPLANEWPLWEVFVRSRSGLDHKHCGSLHARRSADGGADGARRLHPAPGRHQRLGGALRPDRRQRPGRQGMYFDPMEDKVYRHPTFYQLPARSTTCEVTPDASFHRHRPHARRCSTCCASATPASILAQRLAEWSGHAPILEEDIALSNTALDLIGQARARAHACRPARRPRPRRGPAGLPARREGLPQPHAGRAAARRLRLHRAAQHLLRDLAEAALGAPARLERCRAGGDRRQGREGSALPPAACRPTGWCGWATAPTNRAARIERALAEAWLYVPEMFESDAVDAAAQASGLGPSWSELRGAVARRDRSRSSQEATLAEPKAAAFRSTGKRGRAQRAHGLHPGRDAAPAAQLSRRRVVNAQPP